MANSLESKAVSAQVLAAFFVVFGGGLRDNNRDIICGKLTAYEGWKMSEEERKEENNHSQW